MIRALDRGVGRVLDALRANGLEENTLVIFTSDNGGANYIGLPDINRPYRGWKMTFFEGGVHTPFFAKWPAALPRGATRRRAGRARRHLRDRGGGGRRAAARPTASIDGVDLVPLARGEAPARPHDALFWRSGHYRAILAGDWKLQVSERPKKTWLFDLTADPTERTNLADARPDKVRELAAVLARARGADGAAALAVADRGADRDRPSARRARPAGRRVRLLGELTPRRPCRRAPRGPGRRGCGATRAGS